MIDTHSIAEETERRRLRALDAEVHEVLFGQPVEEWDVDPYSVEQPFYRSGEFLLLVPLYSSDWNDMALLLDEMKRRGYCIRLLDFPIVSSAGIPTALFWKGMTPAQGNAGWIAVTGGDLPEAVCNAVLKVLALTCR